MTPDQIVATTEACTTLRNGTGGRCLCSFACTNYTLRAHGFKAEDPSWTRPEEAR